MFNDTTDAYSVIRLDISGGRTCMDRISESLLNEFSQEQDLTSLSEQKRFERFASYVVVKRHYQGTFDTNDIVVGKSTGIDGIAIIVNGSLITDVDDGFEAGSLDVSFIFVQAKTSPTFDMGDISTFGYGVRDFFRDTPKLTRNVRVSEMSAIQSKVYTKARNFTRNPTVRLYYVTTGKWVDDKVLKGAADTIKAELEGTNLFGAVEFRPIDAAALQKLYREARNATSADFLFDRCIALPAIPGVQQAYLGFMPASSFVKLVKSEDGEFLGRVFYDNPRDWQNYNPVNTEIKSTLESDRRSRFVLVNNGVTIIADKVDRTGDSFNIQNYQVVNGCQTSHVLYDEQTNLTTDTMVPIRLIGTGDESVKDDIIRATNRQTAINEDQFFVTQEFPKQLETYFESFPQNRRLYYERRDGQYDNRVVEKTRIITHQNLIRAFAAMFLNEAHRTTRNYKQLIATKVGKEIFGKDHRLEPYYLAAVALYRLEYMFRVRKLDAKYKPARFHILMAVRLLAATDPMPGQMNSHDMEKYCNKILDLLWNNTEAETLLERAVSVITEVAKDNYERDHIRSEAFTKDVKAKCERILPKQSQHSP